MAELEFNTYFEKAASFIKYSNKSVFLTGKAGTGKTTFLKYIKENCPKKAAITAPTGVAAINAGGVTLHSLFQLPFGNFIPNGEPAWGEGSQHFYNERQLLRQLRIRKNKRKLIRSLELLVIDEISMVRADLLDAVDAILRSIRRRPEPFGGLQMLFIGDLYQLPPVVKENEWQELSKYYKSPFFFDAEVIQREFIVPIELKKIYRQRDGKFINLLNNVRNNQCLPEDIDLLHEAYRPTFTPDDNDGYITLTTHNRTANKLNAAALERLPGKTIKIDAKVKQRFPENAYPADEVLKLKEGAQIMFIKNDTREERRYFNGKIGTVKKLYSVQHKIEIAFPEEETTIFVEPEVWDNVRYQLDKKKDTIKEEKIGSFEQYPIRLAWAVTIHKSQGLTFEKAVIDAGRAFAPGQVYVALSRLTNLNGLVLHSRIAPDSIRTDPRVQEFSKYNLTENDYEDILEQGQKDYAVKLLIETYRWSYIEEACSNHYQNLIERFIPRKEEAALFASRLVDSQSILNKTGQDFRKWLLPLLRQNPFPQNFIQNRNHAAIKWFLEHIEACIRPITQEIKMRSEEKTAKTYLKDLKELLRLFERKKAAIERSTVLIKALGNEAPLQEAIVGFLQPVDITKTAQPALKKPKVKKGDSKRKSLALYQSGKSIPEIAKERSLAESTIGGHLTSFIPTGEVSLSLFVSDEEAEKIKNAMKKWPDIGFSELKIKLNDEFDYPQLKAVFSDMEKKED